MSLVPYNLVALAEDDTVGSGKNIVAGASVNILKVAGGIAQIYEDEGGTMLIGLPTVTDGSGELNFFIEKGEYFFVVDGESKRVNILSEDILNGYAPIISKVNDISSITAVADKVYFLKEYNEGSGKGGGYLVGDASGSADNGITFAGSAGTYFKRINYQEVTPELFGYDSIVEMSPTTLTNYFAAGGMVSDQIGVGANFTNEIIQNRRNVHMLVMGDSTGNANDEWVYLTAQKLGQLYPTHSVQYHLWNETSYFPSEAISTGTGSYTIHVWNASIPGATAAYFLGDKRTGLYAGYEMDLVIYSYGHNMGTAANYNQIFNYHVSAIEEFISSSSRSEHVITIQNIDTEFPDYSELQAKAMRNIASVLGCWIIDVRTTFAEKQAAGSLVEWMGDLIHPNATGEKVWANIVYGALTSENKKQSFPKNILADSQTNLIYNDSFYRWAWNDSLPTGYTLNAYATVLKDTSQFETKGYSVRLTSTGGAGQFGILTNNMSGALSKLNKENGITFSARVRPSTGSDFNCGRVEVGLGTATVSSWPRTEPKNGWYWASVYVTAAQLQAATQLNLSVYSGDTGDICHLDRLSLNEGNLVRESKFKPIQIVQFYDPSKVIKKTANDALTITGNQVAVVNTVDAYPGFGVNLTDLEIGKSYKATWISSVSAASSGAYVRSYGLQGAIQATATPLNANQITFTAIADSASIQFEILAVSAGTSFTVSAISIMLAP